MNILNTGHLFAKGRGAGAASTDALSVLGDQLMLDPEMLKLLEAEGGGDQAENMDFSKLLENLSEEQKEALLAKGVSPEGIPGKELSAEKLKSLLSNSSQPESAPINQKPTEEVLSTKEGRELSTLLQKSSPSKNVTPKQVENVLSFPKDGKADIKDNVGIEKKVSLNKENKVSQESVAKVLDLDSTIGKKKNIDVQTKLAQKAYTPESKSLFNKQNSNETLINTTKKPEMKLQDILLNNSDTGSDLDSSGKNFAAKDMPQIKTDSSAQTAKVFNLSSLNTTDAEQVITKIQNYIVQAKAASEPRVEMSFSHADLGKVDLLVQKNANDISIVIGTNTREGADFFSQKQGDLLGVLAKSGVQVGEFKLESSSSSSNQNNSQDSSKQQSFANNGKQHNSESGQRQEESRKREELWELLKDKEVA